MATNDKLAYHAWDAKQQYTEYIDNDKNGTTILTRHIRETPYVA
jgi:hypothetical protein